MRRALVLFSFLLAVPNAGAIGCIGEWPNQICVQGTHTEEVIPVVEKYFASLAAGDLVTLGNLFADDVIWHQPGKGQLSGIYNGKKQVFDLFGDFMKISQGSFKIDSVTHIMSNGPWVTATLHFSAANKLGSISMAGVDLMRIEHGKIKEVYLFSADQAAEDKFWIK